MKRPLLPIVLVIFVFASLALAIQVGVQDFFKATGLHLPDQAGKLAMNAGQSLATRIDCVGKKNWTFVDDPSDQKIEYVEVHVDDSWTSHCPEARVR